MKKISFFLKRYKFTICFILLSLVLPFVILTVINRDVQIPRDIVITFFINILLFLILGKKIELEGFKKTLGIAVPVLISIFSPLILMILFIVSPTQKEHDRIMYEICLPELKRHYGIQEGEAFPQGPIDKDGNSKWWFQHLECENNVPEGKGPIFSENPSAFYPVK